MSNHSVTIDGGVVRKRYARTDRDEPAREWRALVLLDEHARGLAPRPIAREVNPPAIVMSRVEGQPLLAALSADQTTTMVRAYRTLFTVPLPPDMPLRHWAPADFLQNNIRWMNQALDRIDLAEVVNRALEAALAWHTDYPLGLDDILDPVLAQGDGKVDNMLWDGERVRLVDFEASGVGDLAFEVADLAEHISASLLGLRDSSAVIDGFELDQTQRDRVDAYRIVLATLWLWELLPGNRGEALNPDGSVTRQAEHLLGLLGR